MARNAALLIYFLVYFLVDPTLAYPRFIREEANDDIDTVVVTTAYGAVKGINYNISETVDLNIFLGVPYAQPPVGDLRLARPQHVQAWSPSILDATRHGPKCVQRIIREDPVLEGVPFSEDCLFLDIYATRLRTAPENSLQPVMVYIHPGGFYGGSGAKYNFTNLALKGVVVVCVSYRLDVFGFLSTQDDVIPGNFGLLDAALALEFVKEIISDFGGDAGAITLFGASSGAAMVSIFTLSPLTRGKFQQGIMMSGEALCPWAVFTPGRTVNVPADLAMEFGRRLNCSLSQTGSGKNVSRDLLACLRGIPVDTLVRESVTMQEQVYGGDQIFIPVSGDSFGVLPETPEKLLAKTSDLVAIPTITGYTTDDGSWLVPDLDDDGVTYPEFQYILNAYITQYFPPSERNETYTRVVKAYLPDDPASLTPLQLRGILVRLATDAFIVTHVIKQARLFSQAEDGNHRRNGSRPGTFVYQFNYRPSYSPAPVWQGVRHADEKGFVLGLPPGPNPFNYPNTTAEDEQVADLVTTMWSNFAKFGHPTPQPFNWSKHATLQWPAFGNSADNQELLQIDLDAKKRAFDRNQYVAAWTG
ncbi:carboxylic ester hydrolase [Elysia marginata]|uniref:Carboxylic ester hydrolase n=1 Tax=Elysia marginata TaxID=1093978 RepID=A0AAV4F953_9GAST|nr:carboxylic ester hydrolase [Elysia marginata]